MTHGPELAKIRDACRQWFQAPKGWHLTMSYTARGWQVFVFHGKHHEHQMVYEVAPTEDAGFWTCERLRGPKLEHWLRLGYEARDLCPSQLAGFKADVYLEDHEAGIEPGLTWLMAYDCRTFERLAEVEAQGLTPAEASPTRFYTRTTQDTPGRTLWG
jgi:hypothetical protein